MKFNNQTYDLLKKVAQYVLPAIGTLYFAVAQLWNLPGAEQVIGTVAAIDAFLGAMLGISTSQYNKELEELKKKAHEQSEEQ